MNDIDTVRAFYENYDEWSRFERHGAEFAINKRYLYRYIKSGDTVLDIGGGPGRYALDLASRGCKVTLMDLTPKHIEIAQEKATQMNLKINTVCGDACCTDQLIQGQFDAVLLMGPLYHLSEEADRVKAVEAALKCLKPGGVLYAAFISSYAGVWDYLTRMPEKILAPADDEIFNCVLNDKSFSGISFTASHLIRPGDVDPFMAQFPLEKLHLLSSESVLFFREKELQMQSEAVWNAWLDFAEKVCEREEFLGITGHFLYIGRKQ